MGLKNGYHFESSLLTNGLQESAEVKDKMISIEWIRDQKVHIAGKPRRGQIVRDAIDLPFEHSKTNGIITICPEYGRIDDLELTKYVIRRKCAEVSISIYLLAFLSIRITSTSIESTQRRRHI